MSGLLVEKFLPALFKKKKTSFVLICFTDSVQVVESECQEWQSQVLLYN